MLETRIGAKGAIIVARSKRSFRPLGQAGMSRAAVERTHNLLSLLQTTLDPESLLRLFSRAMASSVPHSSVSFTSPARAISMMTGRPARFVQNFELMLDGEDLGNLVVTRGKPFEPDEIRCAESLVSTAIYPLRNALRYRDAVQDSLTDPLTGLFNRKFLDTALRREIALARRHSTPLALIILDVDEFKTINDTLGHEAGDAILKQFAVAVGVSLRETDILARFGGDELVVLLPNTSRHGALQVARNIQRQMASAGCEVNGKPVALTASLGVAALLKRDRPGALFTRADEALYRAKRAGRALIGFSSTRGCRLMEPGCKRKGKRPAQPVPTGDAAT